MPQSKAATRVMRWSSVGRDARPGGPPLPERVEHLVAERVDAAALGQRLAGEHVQALDPVGHAAGGDAGDLGHLADRGPRGEVGVVRPGVRRGEVLVLVPSRSVISRISPDASRVPIIEAARGQVR